MTPDWDRWFRKTSGEFCPVVRRFAGLPITYVEIGCWAGACSEWMCRNILTSPQSRGIGIDPYLPDGKHSAKEVAAIQSKAASRSSFKKVQWRWIYEPSATGLLTLRTGILPIDSIDILFVDGDHDAHAVIQDFSLAWPLLKVGSVVIFDDYRVRKQKPDPHVKEGVEAIRSAWGKLLKPIGTPRFQAAFEVVSLRHGGRR